jgi:hypothetical protein
MAQVYGYAASEMSRVGKHTGYPWRQRELKHPEADIRLQDTSQIGKGAFAQIETLPFTLRDILRGKLGIIPLNVVLRRIAPAQGCFTDVLQPKVILGTVLELLDQGGDIFANIVHGRQKTPKPNSKPIGGSAALQELGHTLAQKVRNRQKLRGLEPALAFFDGDDRGARHPELFGELLLRPASRLSRLSQTRPQSTRLDAGEGIKLFLGKHFRFLGWIMPQAS